VNHEVYTTMSLPKFGAFLLLAFSAQFALAASVSQEKSELASLQRNLAAQEQKLSKVNAELQTLPTALEKAQADLASVEPEYNTEKSAFNKIKIENTASPSESTERQFKLAEIKFGLAERRYQNAKSEVDKLKEREQQLKQELASTETAIKNNRDQVRRQEIRLADTIETEERLAQEAARTKAEQERKAQLAASKPVIEPPKPIEPEPAPVVTAPAPSKTVELTPAEIEELNFAKAKMSETEQLVAKASGNDNPSFSNLSIDGSNFEDIPFQHLGNNQYRADVTLHAGRHSFQIEDLRFRVDVPDTYTAGQVYVFLVDGSDRNRLRASYFRKELLNYFDKEVVTVQPKPTMADNVAAQGVVETAEGILMSKEEYKEFQFAKEKMAETEKAVAQTSSGDKANIDNLQLRNSDIGDLPFEYLGNQQYRADVALPSGRHAFRVESLKFNVDVPQASGAQEYTFLVDAREKNNLRASYFRKFLLNYANEEVAVAQ